MRAIFDANIFVSFLLTKGQTISKVFNAWEQNKFILLVSDEIMLEIKNILARFVEKQLIPAQKATLLLRRIRKDSKKIETFSGVYLSPDKKDNRYLSCAKDGKADYLVTGDKKHLLALKKFGKTKIISPAEFLNVV